MYIIFGLSLNVASTCMLLDIVIIKLFSCSGEMVHI